jgi:hypothetical protein
MRSRTEVDVQALRDMLVQPENLWKKMEEFSVSEICVLQVICVCELVCVSVFAFVEYE